MKVAVRRTPMTTIYAGVLLIVVSIVVIVIAVVVDVVVAVVVVSLGCPPEIQDHY